MPAWRGALCQPPRQTGYCVPQLTPPYWRDYEENISHEESKDQAAFPPCVGTVLPFPGAWSADPFPLSAALPRSEDSASVRLPTASHARLALRTHAAAFPLQRGGCRGSRRLSHVHAGALGCVLWFCTPAEPASPHPLARMLVWPFLVGDTVGRFDHARCRSDGLPVACLLRPADSLATLHLRRYPPRSARLGAYQRVRPS